MEFLIPGMASVPKDSKDYNFSKEIVKLVLQFVKLDTNKNKNPELKFLGERWTPQEANKPLKFMRLNSKPGMISHPFEDRMGFWTKLNLLPV